MSVSTNAILGYGITFEEGEEPWKLEGFTSEYDIPESWMRSKLGEKADSCPLTIEWHCSADYPMYAILVKESISKAYRGFPCEVGLPDETTLQDWEVTIQEWLSAHPGQFWLMSYWG